MSIHAYEYTKKQKQGWEAKKAAENRRRDELRNQQIAIDKERMLFAEKMLLDVDFENDSDIEKAARRCKQERGFWDPLPLRKKENTKFSATVVENGAVSPTNLSRSLQTSSEIFCAYTRFYFGFSNSYSRSRDLEGMIRDFSFAKKDQEDPERFRKELVATFLKEESFIKENPKVLEACLKELSTEERKKYRKLALQILPINQVIEIVGDDVLKDREWVIQYFSDKQYSKNQTGKSIAVTYQKLPKELQDDSEIAKAALKGNNRALHVFPVLSSKQKAEKEIALFAMKNDRKLTRSDKVEKLWSNFAQQVQLDDDVLEYVVQPATKESDRDVLLCVLSCGLAGCIRICIDASTKRGLKDQASEHQISSNQSQDDELQRPLTSAVKTAEMT